MLLEISCVNLYGQIVRANGHSVISVSKQKYTHPKYAYTRHRAQSIEHRTWKIDLRPIIGFKIVLYDMKNLCIGSTRSVLSRYGCLSGFCKIWLNDTPSSACFDDSNETRLKLNELIEMPFGMLHFDDDDSVQSVLVSVFFFFFFLFSSLFLLPWRRYVIEHKQCFHFQFVECGMHLFFCFCFFHFSAALIRHRITWEFA